MLGHKPPLRVYRKQHINSMTIFPFLEKHKALIKMAFPCDQWEITVKVGASVKDRLNTVSFPNSKHIKNKKATNSAMLISGVVKTSHGMSPYLSVTIKTRKEEMQSISH